MVRIAEVSREVRRLLTEEIIDSDVLHLEIAGGNYIILNSYQAVTDLLEKRSSIYSSRCVCLNALRFEIMLTDPLAGVLYTDLMPLCYKICELILRIFELNQN